MSMPVFSRTGVTIGASEASAHLTSPCPARARSASGYELLKSNQTGTGHEDWSALALAFVVSLVTAFVAVKWLLGYIRTHRFTPFAIYRIALGVALLAWLPNGA
jgi:undecaprenyl pyrophosphate phosphatase UppP